MALEADLHQNAVSPETLRGETLSFGWEGLLYVDGVAQQISGFKPNERPRCSP